MILKWCLNLSIQNNTNVIHFTRDTVFKISASSVNDALDKSYLRFANEEDKKHLFGGSKTRVFEESTNQTVPLVVRDVCPINKYDTFNLVFPKDDTYRELVFCKDTYLHIKTFLASLEETEEVLDQMSGISHGLFKTFSNIYKFLTNSLEGRINADYDIGEIVEYRQEMIAKVGILIQIFDFLKACEDLQGDQSEEQWANDMIHIFRLPKSESNEFESVLEIVFETLHTLFINNARNQYVASKNIELMQQFVFVPNISKVLIAIFKDKQFEMNKKEIHTEILYRRIYEYDRFQPIVESFVQKLKRTRQSEYVYILRKI